MDCGNSQQYRDCTSDDSQGLSRQRQAVLINPFLPITVAPDNGLVLNITMNITQSEIYKTDLLTSKGNMFSESSQVPTVRQAGVILTWVNTNYYGIAHDNIDVDVQNMGSSDAHVVQIYIGTSSSTLQNQTSLSLPTLCIAGMTARITVDYNWTLGVTYYFKVIAQEQTLGPWADQSPVS